jgi:hypothetical protein
MSLQFREDVSTADTEYGTVLLDERSGRYWQLNPTGTLVVRTLLAGGTPAQAISALIGEFDVDEPQATQDVTVLLEELRSSGLVTR